jgi:hypothetical protein
MKKIGLSKKTQSEILVTILLILIGLAAMALLSTFVINLVKDKFKSGDCIKTIGALSIVTENDASYFDSVNKRVVVTIEQGEETFNLSSIQISVGNGENSKSYNIGLKDSSAEVSMALGGEISLPAKFEFESYNLSVGESISNIDRVKIMPILQNGKSCSEGIIESKISYK